MALWMENSSSEKKSVVGVVGIWGIVGQWLVRRLLQKGYFVRCALSSSPDEAAEMMAIPGAEDRLELFAADMLDYASLAAAAHGCTAIFLTSPSCDSMNGLPEYPADVVNYEVMRTLNVVEACANTPSVKRLLLTSSASAVAFDTKLSNGNSNEKVIDERSWSNIEYCRKNKLWSAVSKTVVEKAAWALARDRGVDLVVINPAIVVDEKSNKTSSSLISHVKEGQRSGVMAFAHVEDVADVHVRAFEEPTASGRFLCFDRVLTQDEIAELCRKVYPNQSFPFRLSDFLGSMALSNQKLRRLGLQF